MADRRSWIPALVLLTTAIHGCSPREPVELPSARQLVVAIDLSGSQTAQSLAESRSFVEGLVDGLSFGDQIVLMEMNRTGVRGELKRFVDSVPLLSDPTFVSSVDEDNLDGTRQTMRSLVPLVFDSAVVGTIANTDIFSTLHTASEYIRESGGRPSTLVLLSDMLQSARGVEMEGLRAMPPPGWIERQRAAGLIPDLHGVCVVVVGADDTTREGVRVKQFWKEYFAAAGARLEESNYRLLSSGTGALSCRSAT